MSVTKKQAQAPARPRVSPEAVVQAALGLLDERGVEAVSMRAIADRLGVRMNTVLWHAKTKDRLGELMADAIVGTAGLDGLPDDWAECVRELARRYRRALLAHRDGARVVTGTYSAEPATLGFAERMIQALLDGNLAEREASWACWTIVYFTLGLVQEEQALHTADSAQLLPELSAAQYPALSRVAQYLTADREDFEQRFTFGISLILNSLPAVEAAPHPR